MPSQTIPVKVVVGSDRDKHNTSQLVVEPLGTHARLMLAMKGMGVCWLIAIPFIFIPVIHFVVPPALFLMGLFIFVQINGLKEKLVSGTIHCPSCKVEIPLKSGAFNWPKRERCPACRADIAIEQS